MRLMLGLIAAAVTFGQGTTPKPSAEDYPAHRVLDGIPIGAEYMVHSFGSGEQMYIAENYLVVEVALYPDKESLITLELAQFGLRINGKLAIAPQPPPTVLANMNHPEWRNERPGVGVGVGAGPIGIGYPPVSNRPPFPGAPQPRYPTPPRAPESDPPGGIDKRKPATAEELLTQTALPLDPHRGPVSGFLFFPYRGKTSSIKSVELTWMKSGLKLR
jgi:hypothetical protein